MMSVRRLYLLATILWALVLSPLPFVAIFGASAGIFWLYVFGDNPWPPFTEWLLLLLSLAGSLAMAGFIFWLGNGLGRERTAAARVDCAAQRRRAIALVSIPFGIIIVAVSTLWFRAHDYEDAMTAATMREQSFAELTGSNQKITGVEIATRDQDVIRATVRLSGGREGDYRLDWRVVPSTSTAAVLTGNSTLRLTHDLREVPISFSEEELRRRYQAIVLKGRSGALIDELFHFEVFLIPHLTPQNISRLPPGEQRRIDSPDSALRSQGAAQFPVRFEVLP